MKRITNLFFAVVLGLLALCESAWAVEVIEPGYVVQTHATYSKQGIGRPGAMAFAGDGNLYVTQHQDDSIWRITPEGVASEFVTGISVRGIVWAGGTDFGNRLYVANGQIWDGRIFRVGLDGTVSNFASFEPPRHCPSPVGLDRTGNYGGYLYAATGGQDHTYRVDTNGSVTLFTDFPGWNDGGGPVDIAFDTGGSYDGLMYMSTSFVGVNQHKSGLFALDTSGNASRFTEDLVTAGHIDFDLTGDFDGDMFVTGKGGFDESWEIWCVSPDGTAMEFARTTVSDPYGLAFGPDGAMYVAEYSLEDETVIISRVFWPATPHEVAINNIEQAIAKKIGALERIDTALEKERVALDALNELHASGELGDLSRKDIQEAKQKIHKAIIHEKICRRKLGKTITELEDALVILGVEPLLDPNLVAY